MQQRGVLFIADEQLGYDFINSNNELKTHLMAGTETSFINYKSPNHPTTTNSTGNNNYDTTSGTATKDVIIREVNKNPFVIAYAGHGTNGSWSGSQILNIRRGGTVDDSASFTNGGSNLSLFILLTCLNGSFADFSNETISERQMKNVNGGSIGIWSSSGLTIPESQDPMGARFYDLYRDGIGTVRLGELTRQAKLATGDPDVRYSWVLLGDPTLRVK
ncbi:MAG: hypothetical protein H7Z37_05605 [Pyrinomonadaceae bacterium]|nr:hypothetical protein [Pyrinomonadaceae bacterium]